MRKRVTCSYLYADGHAVIVWEKTDKEAGDISWVEVHEQWTKAVLCFDGRIVFSRYEPAMMDLAKRCYRIRATAPDLKHGSENTRKAGIAVGDLSFSMDRNTDQNLHWHTMPGLISAPFTYQPEVIETCPLPDEMLWGHYRIGKFHAAKRPQDVAKIAA